VQTTPEGNGQQPDALERLTRLQALTASLPETVISEQVATAILAQAAVVLGANAGVDALRVSEEWFARFMQHLPGLAWIKDVHGRYVYANDAAVNAFGKPRAEICGRTDEEVFPTATAAQFRENDRKALASGAGVRVVETLEHPDGASHYSIVSKFPIPGPDGAAALVGGMAIDITEEMRTRAVLEESKERFRATFEQAAVGIAHVGPDGRWLRVNRKLCEIVGYCPDELLALTFQDITHPDDLEADLAQVRRLLAGEIETYSMEKRYFRKDRSLVWINLTVSLVRTPQGQPKYFISVVEDITEQKAVRDALRESEERLREANRRKDEFLAMLGHELRNPLAPIRNAAHVLRLLSPADPNLRKARDIIERQVEHMTRLVDDLLDVSRITRGIVTLRKVRVELASVVCQAVETSRHLIEARGHNLTVELAERPVWLDGDATRLAQVFSNLLNNASKYTPDGGHIRLTIEVGPGEAVVRVRDNGVGIAADLLPRLFDLFAQGDRSLARSEGGLGIGLSMVKSLVEMHGGSVLARSDGPGLGSEFIVRLPTLPASLADAAADVVSWDSELASPPRRVLVVDDNVDVAASFSMYLRSGGHDVRIAHNGPAALEAAKEFQPEVVLLDIGLPKMDGYEVARRLREQSEGKNSLLVAVTGYGQEEDRRQAEEAGFDAHLVKPADLTALRRLLTDLKGSR
jgi:PAS domain S-box-containing protein